MTIDDLISEGKTFKMKYSEPKEYINSYGIRCIEPENYYFEDNFALSGWIEKCRRYIGVNFHDDQSYEDFCSYGNMTPTDGSVARMVGILISLRDIQGNCPIKESKPSTSISFSQSQSQTQTIELVMKHLDEEFSESQIQQISDIVNANLPKSTKRIRLYDLFKNFGVSIGANLLTSLLIN